MLIFKVLALRQSGSMNLGLYVIYIQKGGAVVLVGTW